MILRNLGVSNVTRAILRQSRFYNNANMGWSMQHAYSIPRKLTEVVKLPLFQREDAKKIRELWLEHFKDKQTSVGGVLAAPE